ncbi:MAG: YfiR family protein [Candidatus Saccharicenans sp.]
MSHIIINMGCHRRVRFKIVFCFAALLTLLLSLHLAIPTSGQSKSRLQQYNLDPARELELIKKILIFERNWKEKTEDSLVIGILYQKSYQISAWVAQDWLAMEKETEEGIYLGSVKLILKPLALDEEQPVESLLGSSGVSFAYLTPLELQKQPRLLLSILKTCEKLRVGTFTAVPEYLESGAAVAFNLREEKPQIIINLDAARSQGMNFSSQFLKLTTVKK